MEQPVSNQEFRQTAPNETSNGESNANLPQSENGETMSLGQTLIGIFFEPGRTFAALRLKPRFLVAAAICVFMFMTFNSAFIQKIGFDNIIRQQLNSNPQTEQMSAEQKTQAIAMYQNPAMQAFFHLSPIIGLFLVFVGGALIYWAASAAFGGSANFLQALSLFVYASLPVYLISMLLNIVVLLLKPASEIDPVAGQRGLLSANPGFLIDSKASPLAASLLGSLDLFSFYGMFLAALGFQKIARLPASSSWAIVIVLWLVTVVFRVAGTLVFGTTM